MSQPDEVREKNLSLLLDQVEKRIAFEIESRKWSETRALAIITLNVGIVTLYFGLRAQLGIWTQPVTDWPRFSLLASTVLQFSSIVVALIALIPAHVRLLQADAFGILRLGAMEEQEAMTEEILEARIAELGSLNDISRRKAGLTLAALIVFAAAVVLFVAAVFFSIT